MFLTIGTASKPAPAMLWVPQHDTHRELKQNLITSDFRHLTSDIRHQTSDLRLPPNCQPVTINVFFPAGLISNYEAFITDFCQKRIGTRLVIIA
jgi:hypothetical protein